MGGARMSRIVMAALVAVVSACGGSPKQPGPTPIPQPPPVIIPPANNAPAIESISVQGTRRNQPANFADTGETVPVTAVVKDDETAADQLQYNWTATMGSFTGTGARVSWVAPATAATPLTVVLTLEVVERYNTSQEHRITKTASVDLHNSAKEIGDMSVRFLTEFSKPQTNKDWRDIMRDFKASACPRPSEIDAERADVERHYTNFFMHNFRVDPAAVTVGFGATCAYPPPFGQPGDACSAVAVLWDSTDLTNKTRKTTVGVDHMSAAFSTVDKRWYLCSSYFQGANTLGHAFYSR